MPIRQLLLLAILTSAATSFAADPYPQHPRASSGCVRELVEISNLPVVEPTAEIQSLLWKAESLAYELTEKFGVAPHYTNVVVRGYRSNYVSQPIAAIEIRVADDSNPGQANAFEFVFKVTIPSKGPAGLRLLTIADDWHTSGDYDTIFVCEDVN